MYPDERVSSFINSNFIPVKIHVKENPGGFQRFGAQWTPTIIIADSNGTDRHRFEGFLPVDDFLAQLELGLARIDFASGKFPEAEKRFRAIAERFSNSEVAPEALYWAGVSRYKGSNDAGALTDTAAAFKSRYKDSAWAKKASVWAA